MKEPRSYLVTTVLASGVDVLGAVPQLRGERRGGLDRDRAGGRSHPLEPRGASAVRLARAGGGRYVAHLLRTLTLWIVGLMNTVWARPGGGRGMALVGRRGAAGPRRRRLRGALRQRAEVSPRIRPGARRGWFPRGRGGDGPAPGEGYSLATLALGDDLFLGPGPVLLLEGLLPVVGAHLAPQDEQVQDVGLISRGSPSVTMRLASFPRSMVPSLSPSPSISAPFFVTASRAASSGQPVGHRHGRLIGQRARVRGVEGGEGDLHPGGVQLAGVGVRLVVARVGPRRHGLGGPGSPARGSPPRQSAHLPRPPCLP